MNIDELKSDLLRRGVAPYAVSFENGASTAFEQYCIEKQGGVWLVYFFERGNKNDLRVFTDEDSACIHLKAWLERDETVWRKGGES